MKLAAHLAALLNFFFHSCHCTWNAMCVFLPYICRPGMEKTEFPGGRPQLDQQDPQEERKPGCQQPSLDSRDSLLMQSICQCWWFDDKIEWVIRQQFHLNMFLCKWFEPFKNPDFEVSALQLRNWWPYLWVTLVIVDFVSWSSSDRTRHASKVPGTWLWAKLPTFLRLPDFFPATWGTRKSTGNCFKKSSSFLMIHHWRSMQSSDGSNFIIFGRLLKLAKGPPLSTLSSWNHESNIVRN